MAGMIFFHLCLVTQYERIWYSSCPLKLAEIWPSGAKNLLLLKVIYWSSRDLPLRLYQCKIMYPCWIEESSSMACLILLPNFPGCSWCHFFVSELNEKALSRALGSCPCVQILLFQFPNPHCFESEVPALSSLGFFEASLKWGSGRSPSPTDGVQRPLWILTPTHGCCRPCQASFGCELLMVICLTKYRLHHETQIKKTRCA